MESQLTKQEILHVLPSGSVAKPRYHCPFYGFHFASGLGVMMDQKVNECALQPRRHPSCRMETAGKVPNWDTCPISGDVDMGLFLSMSITTFPDEFDPAGASSWKGMPFDQWVRYVMDDHTPRPPA